MALNTKDPFVLASTLLATAKLANVAQISWLEVALPVLATLAIRFLIDSVRSLYYDKHE